MAPVISPAQAALDALACMGLGLLAAALRCLFPMRRPLPVFWADFFAAGAALVLLQGYAAGRSSAGGLRWYMLAAAAVGAFAALLLLLPVRRVFCRRLGWFAGTLLRFAKRCLSVPAKACKSRKTAGQRQKNRTESLKKQLQTTPELLYNSNV